MKIKNLVSEMKKFKCFDCDAIANFPGLCRECTTYDEVGDVVNPIKRVRINEMGNEWAVSKNNSLTNARNRLPLSRGFRQPKKLSKKQMRVADEKFKHDTYWNTEIVNQMSDEIGEDGLIELGDSGGEEE